MFERHGYVIEHVGANAYNGVAIAARHPLRAVQHSGQLDDAALDREPRLITALVDAPIPLRVASAYVPHGRTLDHWHYQFKLEFLRGLATLAADWVRDGHLLVAGDLNVAATDSDVFHPDAFVGATHVSPPERTALAALYGVGLVDADVAVWGARARRFTWWNHGIGYSRNLGMRIDHLAVDDDLATRLDTTWIDHHERGAERPSDHAALIADFALEALGPGAHRAKSSTRPTTTSTTNAPITASNVAPTRAVFRSAGSMVRRYPDAAFETVGLAPTDSWVAVEP
jgi:exodeoxyribonuclease-3